MATINDVYSKLKSSGMDDAQLSKFKSGYESSGMSQDYLKKEIQSFKSNPKGYGAVAGPSKSELGAFTDAQKKALADARARLGDQAAKEAANRMLAYNRSVNRTAPAGAPTLVPLTGAPTVQQPSTASNVPAVTAASTDSGFTPETTDKFGDEAETISTMTGAKVTDQELENKAISSMYDKLDEASKARYAEFDNAFKGQATELQTQYGALKDLISKAYEQSKEGLAQKRAGQMSEVSGKLSGAGVSSSMIANALAEVRNNPALQQEEANITKNYVDGLSAQVNTFNTALGTLNQNRSSLSDKELAFAKDLVAQRKAALEKITAIKKEGIDAIFKPVIESQGEVRKAATDAEMKTKASVYSQREYETASETVRMDKLQDALYQYGSDMAGFDRSKITAAELKKASAMPSFAEAKQYLANLATKKEEAAAGTSGSSASSGTKMATPAPALASSGSTTGPSGTVTGTTATSKASPAAPVKPPIKTTTEGGPKRVKNTTPGIRLPRAGTTDDVASDFKDAIKAGKFTVTGTSVMDKIKNGDLKIEQLGQYNQGLIPALTAASQALGVTMADLLGRTQLYKDIDIISDSTQELGKALADKLLENLRKGSRTNPDSSTGVGSTLMGVRG